MVPATVNAILQDLPLPARLVPWPKATPATLTKCVALALLLHVWLVLLLGNAPGGTAQQGQGVWGAVNVTLRGPVRDGQPSAVLPAVPVPENTRPGDAPAPRWGGAVRAAEPLPTAEPGAARLGESVPVMAVPSPAVPAAAAALLAPAAPVALPSAPVPAPAAPGRVAQEQAAPAALPPAREAAREPVPEPAPPPAPAPAESQLTAPAMRAAPALQPAIVPTTPPLPTALALPAVPAPNALIAAPRPDRQLASPLTQAPASVTTSATAVPLPPMAAPPTLPALAALPTVADAPPVLRQLQAPTQAAAPAAQPPLPRSSDPPPLPTLAPAAVLGGSLPTPRAAAPSLQGAPSATSVPAAADAGAQVGHDVATPPAAAASATPRLNLQLSRPRGGELSRYSSTGALPVLPRPPERDEKLAREIEKAGKADCRNAYTGMGPLAVIPLALDAVRKDGGCKW